jgi:Flp pilus assembly protein TadG
MKRTVTKRKRLAGQSLIECALVLPLLLLLIVNVVNFGAFFYAWISVANAARTGAEYFTTGGVTVGGPKPPVAALVHSLVMNDLKSLPNQASIQVCVSTSIGTALPVCSDRKAAPASAPPGPDDPEGTIRYLIGAVDVTYTYQPIIPMWDFPGLGISATIPRKAIHRQARMRILQ